ncbi:hypothetical protein DL93DRAFT_2086644 [Clavulina sp. PMI_390]|nr:hypothetical protein DL93DRAFT_2086644 [Clavulina sp. PMI_390]
MLLLISEHRDTIQQKIAGLHNSSHPLLRLPPEVLSDIIERVASISDGKLRSSLSPHEQCRLPLSRSFLSFNLSCRLIREISIGSPRCWTDITLIIADVDSTSPSFVQDALERSKHCPFNLTVYFEASQATQVMIKELLSPLNPHIHRCRRIAVWSGTTKVQVSQVTQTIRDLNWHYPALRSVKLADLSQSSTGTQRIQLVPFWKNTDEQIESFDLEFAEEWQIFDPAVSVGCLMLPLRTLKQLKIREGFNLFFVDEILRQCPALTHFEWSSDDDSGPVDGEPLPLPCIKTLRFNGCGLAGQLPTIIAPECTQLCLHDASPLSNEWFLFPPTEMTSMREFPSLRRCSLLCIDRFTSNLHRFLSFHSSIDDILIRGPEYSNGSKPVKCCEIFDSLAFVSSKPPAATSNVASPLLPKLRVFWYIVSMDFWEDEGVVALASAVWRLLLRRPTLRMNLIVVPSEINGVPRELDDLRAKFNTQLFILDSEARPAWAPDHNYMA